jgi:hypothetical protein
MKDDFVWVVDEEERKRNSADNARAQRFAERGDENPRPNLRPPAAGRRKARRMGHPANRFEWSSGGVHGRDKGDGL